MLQSDSELMTEISKIKPELPKRNYFEVLQHMKSNDGRTYGRRCVGTLRGKHHMGQYWIRPNDSIKNHISLEHSCYSTVNTFKRGGSLMKNKRNGSKYKWYHHSGKLVTGLYGLYIDLDGKNIGMKYGSQLIPIYPHLLDIANLPKPSFVIDSGHGIHIIWLFNSEVVIHRHSILAMWRKVEDLFVHRLAKASLNLLGTSKLVDSRVHDAPRYLRIPGSYNCKGGHHLYVKTLEDNHISYSFTGYHSGLYYDYIGQYSRKWVDNLFINKKRLQAKNRKTDEKASSSNISSGLIERNKRLGKQAYLLINRLADDKKLVKVRNSEHIYKGYRNELLFIYAQDRVKLNSKYSLLHDTEKINQLFHNPLGIDEVKKILRLNGNPESSLSQYHYTNAMIVSNKHLDITTHEQHYMKTLIGTQERKRRKAITNHKSSIRCHKWRKCHGIIGQMTKAKWEREKKFNKAIKLINTETKVAAANELGINRKTLARWLKTHSKMGHFMKRA